MHRKALGGPRLDPTCRDMRAMRYGAGGKADPPRQVRWDAEAVAMEEASHAAERVAERYAGRGLVRVGQDRLPAPEQVERPCGSRSGQRPDRSATAEQCAESGQQASAVHVARIQAARLRAANRDAKRRDKSGRVESLLEDA